MNERSEAELYAWIRILFGAVWVLNTILQATPAYAHRFAKTLGADWVAGQPRWIQDYGHWTAHIVGIIGPLLIAHLTVILDGLLALSLISGLGFPAMGWVGVIYNLWLWSTVGGFGGPYVQGTTESLKIFRRGSVMGYAGLQLTD